MIKHHLNYTHFLLLFQKEGIAAASNDIEEKDKTRTTEDQIRVLLSTSKASLNITLFTLVTLPCNVTRIA